MSRGKACKCGTDPFATARAPSPGIPTGTSRFRTRPGMTKAYVGIGSNLGRPRENIAAALGLLGDQAELEVVAVSSLRETDPVGYEDQPRFVNGAAALETELSPHELLERLLEVERRLGRVRGEG